MMRGICAVLLAILIGVPVAAEEVYVTKITGTIEKGIAGHVERVMEEAEEAGAAAVMRPGTELCRLEDTKRLYKQMTEGIPQ